MNAIWAKCRECNHVWPAAQLPMELGETARLLMVAICPSCGNDSPVVAASRDIPRPRVSTSGVPIIRRQQ